MPDIAARLNEALDEWAPASIKGDRKAFQRAIRQRLGSERRHGTSYPSILSYFSGNAAPSVRWLAEAADVLGVRVEWLAFGHGAETDVLEEISVAYTAMSDSLVEQVSGELPFEGRFPEELEGLLFSVADRLVINAHMGGSDTFDTADAMDDVARALWAPLRAWGVRALSEETLANYTGATLTALRILASEVVPGDAAAEGAGTSASDGSEGRSGKVKAAGKLARDSTPTTLEG